MSATWRGPTCWPPRPTVSDAVFNVGERDRNQPDSSSPAAGEAMGRPDLRPEYVPERAINPVPRRLAEYAAARARLGFAATYRARGWPCATWSAGGAATNRPSRGEEAA